MIVYRECYYAFHPASLIDMQPPCWYGRAMKLMRSRFCHVSAFYYDPLVERWSMLEWTPWGIFFGCILEHEIDRYIVYVRHHGGEILKYKAKEKTVYKAPIFAGSYCVAGAKHLSNLDTRAWTADQFYRALLKAGARASFLTVPSAQDDADGIIQRPPGSPETGPGTRTAEKGSGS